MGSINGGGTPHRAPIATAHPLVSIKLTLIWRIVRAADLL